jgi:hypothetical protein
MTRDGYSSRLRRQPPGSAAPSVFISYRRDDSQDVAGRLAEHFVSHLGGDSVFFDVETLEAGAHFGRRIDEAVKSSSVRRPDWANLANRARFRRQQTTR